MGDATSALSTANVLRFRLAVQRVTKRLGAGEFAAAARPGLQDGSPWSGLLSLHARTQGVEADSWRHPSLAQVYGPRGAVYLVPQADVGVFSVGLLPSDPDARATVQANAARVVRLLAGASMRQREITDQIADMGSRGLRWAATAGSLLPTWDTTDVLVRAVEPPKIEPAVARTELARRFFTYLAPASTAELAWYLDTKKSVADSVVEELRSELDVVDGSGPDRYVTSAVAELLHDPPPPPPVMLLPPDDPVVNRKVTRPFVDDATANAVWPKAPPPGVLLLDGHIAGTWRRRGRKVTLSTAKALTAEQHDEATNTVSSFPLPGDDPPQLTVSP